MPNEWNLRCPHCGAMFVKDENLLAGAHLRASLALMRDTSAAAREAIENYSIPCPRCEKLMPVEPRSEFRRRKVVAVEQRLNEIALLATDATGREIAGLAATLGEPLWRMLQTDYPLDRVRDHVANLRSVMETEFADLRASGRNYKGMALFDDMLAIVVADVGERDDLPAAPSDEVTVQREKMFKAVAELAGEKPAEPTAAPAQPAQKAQKCFIATAAYGTAEEPTVVTLCALREAALRPSRTGRQFIRLYEAMSPSIARLMTRSRTLRFLVRHFVVRPAGVVAFWWLCKRAGDRPI